jgi:hypothetical protein
MKNWQFILILIWCFIIANTTLFARGYSYIGYSLLFTTAFGLLTFANTKINKFQKTIYHVIFIVSFINVISEILYKFEILTSIFDPTNRHFLYGMAFVYLIISTTTILWNRKQNSGS